MDAARFLQRAGRLADQGEGGLGGRDRARIHAEIALALEEHVLDFRGFIAQDEAIPVVQATLTETCPVAFCENFERPRSFHEVLLAFEPQDGLVGDDRERMRHHFGEAFRLDPSLEQAARGWLGELARSEEWEAYVEVARRHLEASERRGWPMMLLGAGLWRRGDEEGADSAFQAALGLLPPEEVERLPDVTRILPETAAEAHGRRRKEKRETFRRLMWMALDPLHLTELNERQLEHFARAALAELWFGVPRLGERGLETDRGLIYLRYGQPRWIRQIRIDEADLQAIAFATTGTVNVDDAGVVQDINTGARAAPGGRWIFWTYSRDAPSFVFQKGLGARRVTHALASASKQYEQDARARKPSSYGIPNFGTLDHQVARFKGTGVDVEADVVLGLPQVPEGRAAVEGEAGFFVLPRRPGQEVVRMDASVDLAQDGGRTVTFRVPVNAGRYPYALEVLSDDRSVVAGTRGELEASAFAEEGLALSDVLVARSVEPAVEGARTRRQFRIVPAADLTFRQGEPVGIYFEVYGLEPGPDDGSARYSVEVRVTGEGTEGFLGGVVRRLSELLGRSEGGGTLRWEGTAEPSADRVPEWFTLTLPELEAGPYTVEIRVRDENGGDTASVSRAFSFASG